MDEEERVEPGWSVPSNPLLGAIATQYGRPWIVRWVVLGVMVISAGAAASFSAVTMRRSEIMAILLGVFPGMMAFVALVCGPMMVGIQAFTDRTNGALEQHRLAGVSPRALLTAYVVGPQWQVLLLVGCAAAAAVPFLIGYGASSWLPLGLAAVIGTIVASAGLSLKSLRWALAMRSEHLTQPQQGGAPGLFYSLFFMLVSGAAIDAAHASPGRRWALASVAALVVLGFVRDAKEVLHLIGRGASRVRTTAETLGESLRWLGVVGLLAHLFNPRGAEGAEFYAFAHAAAASGAVWMAVFLRRPSREGELRRWVEGVSHDGSRALMLGAVMAVLASAEFVTLRAIDGRGSVTSNLEYVATFMALTLAVCASLVRMRLSPNGGVGRAGFAVMACVVATPIVHMVAIATRSRVAGAVDSLNPLAFAWGGAMSSWGGVARLTLALGVAALVVLRALRSDERARVRALAALR